MWQPTIQRKDEGLDLKCLAASHFSNFLLVQPWDDLVYFRAFFTQYKQRSFTRWFVSAKFRVVMGIIFIRMRPPDFRCPRNCNQKQGWDEYDSVLHPLSFDVGRMHQNACPWRFVATILFHEKKKRFMAGVSSMTARLASIWRALFQSHLSATFPCLAC